VPDGVSVHGSFDDGPDIRYLPQFFDSVKASRLFEQLSAPGLIPWRQDVIRIGARRIPIPRLNAWYGDASYAYSGIQLEPLLWIEPLLEIRQRVEVAADTCFNSVLLNLYRDENDSVSWHADDERELGPDPVIGSVSLGESRLFELRPKKARTGERRRLMLEGGSLLIMGKGVQRHYEHRLPKCKTPAGGRINLTFRYVHPEAQ
jgi:alkylated DNA repair dioxygenase AlkB